MTDLIKIFTSIANLVGVPTLGGLISSTPVTTTDWVARPDGTKLEDNLTNISDRADTGIFDAKTAKDTADSAQSIATAKISGVQVNGTNLDKDTDCNVNIKIKTINGNDITGEGNIVIEGSGGSTSVDVVQETGSSTSSVMSQNAVTESLKENVKNTIEQLTQEDMLIDLITYGVQWDITSSSPTLTRIGNMSFHKTLPIQNLMRGCLLADDGTINSYLPDNDWTSSTRDGSAGQVMVEIPEFYIRFRYDTTTHIQEVRMSLMPFNGAQLWKKIYVSAYYASLQRSTLKLCSVYNTTDDYRGGNNNSAYDGTYRDMRGTAATLINRTNYRNYARNRNNGDTRWNCYTWQAHLMIYWLFTVEYATLNCQLAINSELTDDGYKQGGLGSGCVFDYPKWVTYNGVYPFLKNGYTDSLGNGSGEISYTVTNDDASVNVTSNVNRYRGIEAPFSYLFICADGININIDCDTDKVDGATGLSSVYRCDNPSKFVDTITDDYKLVTNKFPRSDGYITKEFIGENGDIIPINNTSGSSTTFYCDKMFSNSSTYTSRNVQKVFLLGGSAYYSAIAGFVFVYSVNYAMDAGSSIGTRLCYIE